MVAVLMVALSFLSDSFFTVQNLINILNQNAPLAIMASAMTLVIIGGGFDLSVGAIFAVASVTSAWMALNVDPLLGLAIAPFVGLGLGLINGVTITYLGIHSFLATLATSLVFRGMAILITGGKLIPVRIDEFTWLGRGRIGPVYIAVIVMIVFAAVLMVLLNRTTFGRKVFAVGGNEEAAILSGIRVRRVKIITFAITGFAAGLASAIAVSRISMGQPAAGAGMELEAIAATIIGGTSIYGGQGAIWRSIAGVIMLALINNGFNILNADPFFKDLTTGLIIVAAVAISASGRRR
jgi:ribose transport system permease protein